MTHRSEEAMKEAPSRGHHRVSARELVVGILIAALGYLFEVYVLKHHPDARVFVSHIMEPVVVVVLLALMAGFTWPASWAFFRNSVRAIIALTAAAGIVGGLAVLVMKVLEFDRVALAVGGVILGVVGAFVVAIVLFIRSVRRWHAEHSSTADDEGPFVSWTWGIPVPDGPPFPSLLPVEDPDWVRAWTEPEKPPAERAANPTAETGGRKST